MQEILQFIKDNDNFIISSHVAPDGDNIGSSIAMTKFLKNCEKKAYHFLDDDIPQNLDFITSRANIYKSKQFKDIVGDSEYNLIVLDCGNKSRVNIDSDILNGAKKIICIDHHESNEFFGDINYVEEEKSSTCEVVYDFFKKYDDSKICELTATSLYTGLSTDTGSFMFDCASQSSFIMAADLLSKKADKKAAVISIYQSDDYNFKKLESDLILNYMEKIDDICIMTLPIKKLEQYGVQLKDTENLVNNTINISGVKIGVLIKEKKEKIIKVSLRSKEIINVSQIAKKFGGGGHARAAGCTIEGLGLEESKKLLIDTLKNYI